MSELPPDKPSNTAAPAAVRMKRTKAKSLDNLPLFATDDVLGAALLGPDRVQEWRQIALLLETRGLPKVDKLMGGRYVPAVVAHFDHQYGLDRGGDQLLAPDGVENFEKWKKQKHHS
jgi:hypothetical protein